MKYIEIINELKTNQRNWLITGVAGFIGSNLLENLLILNQKVVGVDNFETGFQHNIDQAIEDAENSSGKLLGHNFTFIKGDITNLEDCHLACAGVDFVLHHAALGSVPRSIEDPINTNRTNIDGFLNMLIASRDAKIKRFVYASSSANYGDHPSLPKVEQNIGNPLSPYAVTKVVNELYANVFSNNYGFDSIGLRYFNIFGKRQDPNGAYAAVIPAWISSILNHDPIFINGDGKTSRDFCYIDNVVQINILAALVEDNNSVNQIYNVAVSEKTNLNDLHQIIEGLLIKRIQGLIKKEPKYREFRVGDVKHSLADISKAKKLLGYQSNYSLAKGLESLVDWYLKK
ncbi:NAD-dependent epimerase/dehydratase family protein [Candidatus Pseudothioglobus sp. Uisw_050_01]|uniref:NAD-dependent epimerase/dehydratase family protein n=1 Tax=Candidatus Pseudothioglobus sp. Uisw_050_01 TaxID=3230997 RepID=UPI003A8C3770